MRRRVFLPTAGVTTPRKDFDWVRSNLALQMEPEPFPDDKRVIMGVNSFGIGGSYAHVLLREYKVGAPQRPFIVQCPHIHHHHHHQGYLDVNSAYLLLI